MVITYLTRNSKKQWKGIGGNDSVVPARVQLNLHNPCAATCGRQHHSVKFKWESFELYVQSSRNKARGRCLMVFTDFVLFFYCEFPQAICIFRIDSGCLLFIWTFLSSVSPSYLWILHTFWDLKCLTEIHIHVVGQQCQMDPN